jgi:hypothetical protein
VHSLVDRNKEIRLQICGNFYFFFTEDPDLPNKLLMIDEAHFHLHGTINKQNLRYWPAANPYELHQRPFMIQNLQFGVLFGSEELLDPNSLRMKNKPSQLHRNITQK